MLRGQTGEEKTQNESSVRWGVGGWWSRMWSPGSQGHRANSLSQPYTHHVSIHLFVQSFLPGTRQGEHSPGPGGEFRVYFGRWRKLWFSNLTCWGITWRLHQNNLPRDLGQDGRSHISSKLQEMLTLLDQPLDFEHPCDRGSSSSPRQLGGEATEPPWPGELGEGLLEETILT